MRALVTGATGYIGSRLVTQLLRSGHEVTATARDTAKLAAFDWPADLRSTEMDVSDAGSCAAAFAAAGQDVDVAYFLVHSIGEGDFATHDLDSARTFGAAARDAGVRRVVYLGGFVPRGEHLSEHLDSRADVGEALAESGVDTVQLRAAIILGAGSTSFELVRHIADRVPLIPLPTWMDHPVSPVAVDDVLAHLVAVADRDRVPADAYDLHNGERPTYGDLLRSFAADRGLHRLFVPFPPVPPALVARVASWLTPLPHELTADLVMSLPNAMDSQDRRLRQLLPELTPGMTTVAQAWERTRPRRGPEGVWATEDPLRRVDTDPRWSR